MLPDPQLSRHRITDLFRTTFILYRRGFWLVTLIVALPLIPFTLIDLLTLTNPTAQRVVSFLQYAFVAVLLDAALITVAARTYTGQAASLKDAYRRLGQRFGVLFVALMLQGFLLMIPGGVLWSALQQRYSLGDAGQTTPLLLVLALLIIVCVVRFYLVTAVAVLERHGPAMTLRQSWRLTRRAFWRTGLIALVSALFGALLTSIPATVISIVWSHRSSVMAQWGYAISTTLLTQLSVCVAWPIQSILATVLYYDRQAPARSVAAEHTTPNEHGASHRQGVQEKESSA